MGDGVTEGGDRNYCRSLFCICISAGGAPPPPESRIWGRGTHIALSVAARQQPRNRLVKILGLLCGNLWSDLVITPWIPEAGRDGQAEKRRQRPTVKDGPGPRHRAGKDRHRLEVRGLRFVLHPPRRRAHSKMALERSSRDQVDDRNVARARSKVNKTYAAGLY